MGKHKLCLYVSVKGGKERGVWSVNPQSELRERERGGEGGRAGERWKEREGEGEREGERERERNNNNNGYLGRLTRTGPKSLHVL